jgi:DNA-binding NarL/FixJ family response regulator
MVREGFGALLAAQPDLTVVGQAADGADAVRLADELHPDEAPRVLMLTTFDLDEYVYDALRSGADSCSRTRPRTSSSTPSASSQQETHSSRDL